VLATGTLRNEQIGNATGIYNLMRNVGGSFGIAAVTTMLARGAQSHQATMVSHLTPYDPVFQQRVSQMVTSMTAQQAYAAIYQTLVRQATLLAYIDNFRLLAFLCLICTPAALLFKKVRSRGRVCCNALMVTRMDADCLRIRIQSASSVANLFLSQ